MKYALFGLGMVLIVVGGYFLYSGSNIVEMERGWSAVIAGTTALTGGIITLGLAGVVKSLEDLKRGAIPVLARTEAGAASLPAQTAASATMEMPVEPNLGPLPAGVEAAPPAEAEVPVPAEESPAPAPDLIPSPLSKERPRLKPKFGARPTPAEPSPAIAELRRRVAEDLALDWPSFNAPPIPPAHEPPRNPPEPAEAVTPPPLGFDDFGEHADIGHEPGPEAFEPEAHEAPQDLPPPPIIAEPEPEPVMAEPSKPAPKAIGRYEADGTVYVMFADGSIEAQSAQGTRRFDSMADLKASFQS
jgi:hypothetical protein